MGVINLQKEEKKRHRDSHHQGCLSQHLLTTSRIPLKSQFTKLDKPLCRHTRSLTRQEEFHVSSLILDPNRKLRIVLGVLGNIRVAVMRLEHMQLSKAALPTVLVLHFCSSCLGHCSGPSVSWSKTARGTFRPSDFAWLESCLQTNSSCNSSCPWQTVVWSLPSGTTLSLTWVPSVTLPQKVIPRAEEEAWAESVERKSADALPRVPECCSWNEFLWHLQKDSKYFHCDDCFDDSARPSMSP